MISVAGIVDAIRLAVVRFSYTTVDVDIKVTSLIFVLR